MREWVVICEAADDFRIAKVLAERLVRESESIPDWIKGNLEESYGVTWRGEKQGTQFTPWKTVAKRAEELGSVRLNGYGLRGGKAPASEVRKAYVLCTYKRKEPLDGILFLRDTDGSRKRTQEATEAIAAIRAEVGDRFHVCLGLPHPESEAWILNGFEPKGETEGEVLEKLRHELSFDPRIASDHLRPKRQMDTSGAPIKNSSKNIFEALGLDDSHRGEECLRETPIETLKTRGGASGLASFIDECDHVARSVVAGAST